MFQRNDLVFQQLFTDVCFIWPLMRSALSRRMHANSSTYFRYFSYVGNRSFMDYYGYPSVGKKRYEGRYGIKLFPHIGIREPHRERGVNCHVIPASHQSAHSAGISCHLSVPLRLSKSELSFFLLIFRRFSRR